MDGAPDGSNPHYYGINSVTYVFSRHGLHYRLC